MRKILIVILILLTVIIGSIYLSVSETPDTFRTCELINIEDADQINFKDFDSIEVAASTLYEASFFKEIIQGSQYRDVWSTPITVPIAFLDTLRGGLKIIEEGGGQQTHSLELENPQGVRYTLRSLSKSAEKLTPEIASKLGIENIVVDGISSQHPYSALVVAKLAESANILHTNPELLFIPKQERLDTLNDKYGNRLYYLEYESEGKVNWTKESDILEIIDTEDLQELKLEGKRKVRIDLNALIRARMFDLVIGDWDRHAKQWGWALKEVGDELIAIPVPADRDNAFFNQDGVLPSVIINDYTVPKIQSFEKEITHLPGLVRTFDEYFLRTASQQQFIAEAEYLKEALTSTEIEAAFKAWPAAIDSLTGPEIREKIHNRLEHLDDYALKFHKILSERPLKKIELKGSEELELSPPLSNCFDCQD